MKNYILLLFISGWTQLNAQTDSALFDSKLKLVNGIYTTCAKLIHNKPKYPVSIINFKADGFFTRRTIYFYDQLGHKLRFKDNLFAIVHEGRLGIIYMYRFYNLILTGAISTFFIENTTKYSSGYTTKDDYLYFVDLKTGDIGRLNEGNIEYIVKRDTELYLEFMSATAFKRNKTLYTYILKYNQRNPIYVRSD